MLPLDAPKPPPPPPGFWWFLNNWSNQEGHPGRATHFAMTPGETGTQIATSGVVTLNYLARALRYSAYRRFWFSFLWSTVKRQPGKKNQPQFTNAASDRPLKQYNMPRHLNYISDTGNSMKQQLH